MNIYGEVLDAWACQELFVTNKGSQWMSKWLVKHPIIPIPSITHYFLAMYTYPGIIISHRMIVILMLTSQGEGNKSRASTLSLCCCCFSDVTQRVATNSSTLFDLSAETERPHTRQQFPTLSVGTTNGISLRRTKLFPYRHLPDSNAFRAWRARGIAQVGPAR